MEYKAPEINKEELGQTIVEKHGVVVKFPVQEILSSEFALDKLQREIEGTKKLKEDQIKNIEEHHPVVKTMEDKDMFACGMYQKARAEHEACIKKLEEIKTVLTEYEDDKKAITEQIPELKELFEKKEKTDDK